MRGSKISKLTRRRLRKGTAMALQTKSKETDRLVREYPDNNPGLQKT
jgi:hypothetical protein